MAATFDPAAPPLPADRGGWLAWLAARVPRLEGHAALRHLLDAVAVADRRQRDQPRGRVQADHLAEREAEPVAPRQDGIGQSFGMRIHRARGHLVQRRFPDMDGRAVDQQYRFAPELAAQPRGEFESAGTATDDDDVGAKHGGGLGHGFFRAGFTATSRVSHLPMRTRFAPGRG